jgi:site-specific recombinase XerD
MSGTDLYTVSKLLGHGSVAVTQMYAHLAPDYLKVSVERLKFIKSWALFGQPCKTKAL